MAKNDNNGEISESGVAALAWRNEINVKHRSNQSSGGAGRGGGNDSESSEISETSA